MTNDWIDIKLSLPPDDLLVEVQGIDWSGEYTMQAKYLQYKPKSPKKGGRWMHWVAIGSGGYYDRCHFQNEFKRWRKLSPN